MTEGSETDGGNTIETSRTTITLPISTGQLFGPFSNPLQWLTLRSSGSACDNSTSAVSHDLFSSVDIARDSFEQNIDVVYKSGQYYFEANKSIDFNATNGESSSSSSSSTTTPEKQLPKLYAWFSESIKADLPAASTSTLNGGIRYYCALCNEVFMYPNPVVLHMLCTCPKRVRIDSIPPPNNGHSSTNTSSSISFTVHAERQESKSAKTNTTTITNSVTTKKRGFDIASLVNEDYCTSSSGKRSKNGVEEADVTSHYQNETLNSTRDFHAPNISATLQDQNSSLISSTSSSYPHSSMNSKALVTSTSSAFKNVVQKQRYLTDNVYDLSSFYQRITASSMLPSSNQSSYMPSLSISGSLSASLSSSIPTPLLTSQSKSLVSSTLLPYLPPSLAALTYPTTNYCAKCNASFRMTSDLVYHMRSHHKMVTSGGEQLKKKREEKLKCNICSETFRERHHLTRHMASHQ